MKTQIKDRYWINGFQLATLCFSDNLKEKRKLVYKILHKQSILNNNSRGKKDDDLLLGSHLETQSKAGEENKQQAMPVHVDNLNSPTFKETKKELKELQEAYDIAMKEINNLRAKRQYWEQKFKKLEAKNVRKM